VVEADRVVNGAGRVAKRTLALMREGWGRIVDVTTSLGTMLNAGSPTYGPPEPRSRH
jgi:hypothetical protein